LILIKVVVQILYTVHRRVQPKIWKILEGSKIQKVVEIFGFEDNEKTK